MLPMLCLLISLVPPALSFPYEFSYQINCGDPTTFTDSLNTTWLSDRFYTGGFMAVVSEPLHVHHIQEKTLRYFPLSFGKKNCYSFSLPSGRYYIRTFTIYDNYDGKSYSPSFDVSVQSNVIFSWRHPWPDYVYRDGAYSDIYAYSEDHGLDICFHSFATDVPVIGSLKLVQIDPMAYGASKIGKLILVNYGRLTCGSTSWGGGISNDTDYFGRSWLSDSSFRSGTTRVSIISTNKTIRGAVLPPNYFPMRLYQHAVVGKLSYKFSVDAKMDYMLWFHFAEIDPEANGKGKRVFDIFVNNKNVSRMDIYAFVGGFSAYSFSHILYNLSTSTLTINLVPVIGQPIICGIENYALLQVDKSTSREQVIAMKALKESLQIPNRMGWNGDPCAPTTWDAWEGVTCHHDTNETALVITQIDLGNQGLKGYISDRINLLSNLVSLNLSSNSLKGTLPSRLSLKSLVQLDLSNNEFSGIIPSSLSSPKLRLLLLNGNLLDGPVPKALYLIGVHGGVVDLSGNKGLCGAPSMPQCSKFWENGGLSGSGKLAISLSCIVFFSVLLPALYIICVKKNRNDYDFAPSHDLTSMAAKKNRYQRQKSLMLLEMESQHAKGLPYVPQRHSP